MQNLTHNVCTPFFFISRQKYPSPNNKIHPKCVMVTPYRYKMYCTLWWIWTTVLFWYRTHQEGKYLMFPWKKKLWKEKLNHIVHNISILVSEMWQLSYNNVPLKLCQNVIGHWFFDCTIQHCGLAAFILRLTRL